MKKTALIRWNPTPINIKKNTKYKERPNEDEEPMNRWGDWRLYERDHEEWIGFDPMKSDTRTKKLEERSDADRYSE